MGGKKAACPLSSAWLFGGGAKAPVGLAETGDTVLERPGMAPTLSVLGDGLGGRGEATESLASSALPPYGPRGTGGSFAPGALSGIRSESGRFLLARRTKKMMAPIRARPPMTPTTAPTMTPVLDPLELSPWDEPSDPLLPEFPFPSPVPPLSPLPLPLPPPPVSCGPLVVARLAGYVCSIELETPAAVTFASAALQ